jgi:hypothetical protein
VSTRLETNRSGPRRELARARHARRLDDRDRLRIRDAEHPDVAFAGERPRRARQAPGRPDVLLVGGLFGIVGYWIATLSTKAGFPTDPVALGVVLSAIVHRVVLGYDVVGTTSGNVLDMSPFERGDRRPTDGRTTPDGGQGRLVVEPWLPYQYRWSHVTLLGAIVGVLGGYLAYLTASAFLAFGISVVALAFLCADVADIPVTHHMSLPASTVVVASVETAGPLTPRVIGEMLPLGEAVLLGGIFGIIGALVGEIAQRVFYAHADTHLDPPAASIVVTTLFISVLSLIGVLPNAAWIPLPI